MSIDNYRDVIDSRDVIERIEELETEREEHAENAPALAAWDESDEGQELATLRALAEECEGYASDWKHGEALIRASYFTEYAQQLAEDCGMVNSAATWPNNCIDWEQAARELKYDYTEVDFGGTAYYIRAS